MSSWTPRPPGWPRPASRARGSTPSCWPPTCTGVSRGELTRLALLGGRPPSPGFTERYDALVDERARRVPLQHLTGRAPFRDLELAVGPGVFVPRPETEDVAGAAIDAARAVRADSGSVTVVDLCAGSAAIALAVATEVPGSRVVAVEVSPAGAGLGRGQHRRAGARPGRPAAR